MDTQGILILLGAVVLVLGAVAFFNGAEETEDGTETNKIRPSAAAQNTSDPADADDQFRLINEFGSRFKYIDLANHVDVPFEIYTAEYDSHFGPLKLTMDAALWEALRARQFVAYKAKKHERILQNKLAKCVDDYGAINHSKKLKVLLEFVRSQCMDHLYVDEDHTVGLIDREFIKFN